MSEKEKKVQGVKELYRRVFLCMCFLLTNTLLLYPDRLPVSGQGGKGGGRTPPLTV